MQKLLNTPGQKC